MEIPVVPIGNSKGIRIPKTVLQQLNIEEKLEMEVHDQEILLKPVAVTPRIGWKEAFIKMNAKKDDSLVITDKFEEEDFEWEW